VIGSFHSGTLSTSAKEHTAPVILGNRPFFPKPYGLALAELLVDTTDH